MKQLTRPDGRCFVVGEVDDDLPRGRVYTTADEGDEERIRALAEVGFTPHRRELVLRLPTDQRRWKVDSAEAPAGVAFVRADEVDETRLRLLDDLLRQGVPGSDGWRWDAAGFRRETYEAADFDPATYLVAADARLDYVGIARVWMNPDRPRLGFVGVRADWRRRGVARALLAAVLNAARDRGVTTVRTEVDETNVASRTLLARFGAEVVGASLELVR